MRVGSDKRSRAVERAPDAERAAREARIPLLQAETAAAKALATIERRRSYLFSGYRSVHGWARDAGYAPLQVRRLLRLGRALLDEPDLEPKVADGSVPAEVAAQIGRLFRDPFVQLDEEQRAGWKRRAELDDPDRVRHDVDQAIEEARQGAPTFPMRFQVTQQTRDGFHRARVLMGQGQRTLPTHGEVLGGLVHEYLLRHDPLERELPHRDEVPDHGEGRSRYVSQRVRATVKKRSGGTCEICGERRAIELIHLVPFAQGGTNEADNLADCCRDCHVLYDAGAYRFAHHDDDGRPVFDLDRDQLREDGEVRERAPPAYRVRRARAIPSTSARPRGRFAPTRIPIGRSARTPRCGGRSGVSSLVSR